MHLNDEVNWYIKELSKSPQHFKLLDMSLGRILKHATSRAEDWRMICTDAQANTISDWIEQSLHLDASWLNHLDPSGRPIALTRMKTVEQLEKMASKGLMKLQPRAENMQNPSFCFM